MSHKGKILIIGGAEDIGENDFLDRIGSEEEEFKRYEILNELLNESKNKKIEIILAASRFQEETRRKYERAFDDMNYPNPGFMPIQSRRDSDKEEYIDRIKKAGAVFFTGGDQSQLCDYLGDTYLMEIIKNKYESEHNFLIAGTSAGAMALCSTMIAGGGKQEALFNADLQIKNGLGLLDKYIIDTHFIKRGRFSRLAHAVILHPEKLGVGLGEDTALIVRHGTLAECRGSGMVVIIDGEHIAQTNIKVVGGKDPIYVDNLKVHLLVRNCRFSVKMRRLLRGQSKKLKERHSEKKKEPEKRE